MAEIISSPGSVSKCLCGLAGALSQVSMSHQKGTGSEADSKANFRVPRTVPGVQFSCSYSRQIRNFLEASLFRVFLLVISFGG